MPKRRLSSLKNKQIYIPNIDAKDIYIASQYTNKRRLKTGYSLKKKAKEYNLRRFYAALDFSLDQIKLREVYEDVYGATDFSFRSGRKSYTSRVINVTFKYAVREFNRIGGNTYIKIGHCERDLQFDNCVCVIDGELVGIVVDSPFGENPLPADMLTPYFESKDGQYKLKKTPKLVCSTAEAREYVYKNGFWCDGVHYIRWKRSTGSARVGKCLFIDEALYPEMHRWELCGLRVEDGDATDLAGLESYLSLPSSSIIDVLELNPENVLVIDDWESVFDDDVVSVEEEAGRLVARRKKCEIKNSIWDGQGLISPDAMGAYSDKGMVLLRNLFFKCCCFNTNLQQWFADNGITSVSQLRGATRAQKIEDIKLITTPSSIKYLKFGTLDAWFDNIEPMFGVVKYDKKTHFFDGRMVSTHYQLLNTLQMTKDEVAEFLRPTFDYMTQLRENPAVLRYHIKYPIDNDTDAVTPAQSKNDIIYKMLGINDRFAETKLYYDFRTDIMKSFTKNLKLGHVLVNGNYSVLLGNGMEMLRAAIGTFAGTSSIPAGCVHSTRFAGGCRLLGSRSPHITCSNVWLPRNVASEEIDKYFNLTPEVLYINSIEDNVLNRLSGCDFDSDTVLLTDNPILVRAALRNEGNFPIAVSNVEAKKTARTYTREQQCDLDIKTSNNLIGDIVNLSQECNTLLWDKLNNGETLDDVQEIYDDVCILNVMSGIEIDKAKREFNINSQRELADLRDKYRRQENGKNIKPHFFAAKDRGKGYYDTSRKNYAKHDTTMDYLQTLINSYRMHQSRGHSRKDFLPFSEIVTSENYDHRNIWKPKVERIIKLIRTTANEIRHIYQAAELSDDEKRTLASVRRQDGIEYVGDVVLTRNTMIYLLKNIESDDNRDIRMNIFNTLFGWPNSAFYDLIRQSSENSPCLIEDPCGEITLYDYKFRTEMC